MVYAKIHWFIILSFHQQGESNWYLAKHGITQPFAVYKIHPKWPQFKKKKSLFEAVNFNDLENGNLV